MGIAYSQNNQGVEQMDLTATSYRYPPKSGNYFSSHFLMGDQSFAGTQPESFLFGDNNDLNFLPPRPMPFPYPEAMKSEPTKLLRSLINLRKDSLRLVKHVEGEEESEAYYIEFTFDADVKCAVTIHYLACEDLSSGHAIYKTRDPSLTSRSFEFDKGANQLFSFGKFHLITPNQFKENELIYSDSISQIPVVIHITALEEEFSAHSNITMANIEKSSDNIYSINLLRQKQMVDGLCYLLHEIYGLESKEENEDGEGKAGEEHGDYYDDDYYDMDTYQDENVVCVVCLSNTRDTLMLPCKHLCVCSECAGKLRRGSNNCPICRVPFHALLQLCAYQRANPNSKSKSDEQFPGYQKVDLFDALNDFNITKESTTSSREIVHKVSALARSKSRPSTPKPSQKCSTEERMTRRSSSRFSRGSRGSHKYARSDTEHDTSVDSLSKTSLRRSRKGSVKSHVVEVEDSACIVDMNKESTADPAEGLELGVEVGQDNLGMDSVEEETRSPRKIEDSGVVDMVERCTSHERPSEAPNPLTVPLPGTPLFADSSDSSESDRNTPEPFGSSVDNLRDEQENGETCAV